VDGRPSTACSVRFLQNSVGSGNVLKIQKKNQRLSSGQVISPQHMSLENITNGEEGREEKAWWGQVA
jgi:hypothetical protein